MGMGQESGVHQTSFMFRKLSIQRAIIREFILSMCDENLYLTTYQE